MGKALLKSIRHFWPDFNDYLDDIPDGRFRPYITYHKRFLLWWGLSLYLFQLGARRQLDFDLDARGTHVLDNFNRLAQTEQTTRPVQQTLNHFLKKSSAASLAGLRTQVLQRLIRMKSLDAARLQGRFVLVMDGTGHLCFRERHCPNCLVQEHENYTLYMHQVLEAKLLGPAGLTLSIGTEFIDNSDGHYALSEGSLDERKQDCELKALDRLLPVVRRDFPQLRLCLAGDNLYACGRLFQSARDHDGAYVVTFKEKSMPAVWADFQSLLPLCPENVLERTSDEVRQVYRWAPDLSYEDDRGRRWTFTAIQCEETTAEETTTFAWLTDLTVNARTVVEVATKGGRARWQIENQGFNRQKNSGFQLEHVFSTDPELLKSYYYLMQIAHILLQVFEQSNLLRRLAAECGKTWQGLFGSLKNLARRLLDCFRYHFLPSEAFALDPARRIQIRFDTS